MMKAMQRNLRLRDGFTLVELLGVILVIAILMGLAFRMTSLAIRNTERAKGVEAIESIKKALEAYYAEYGVYPPTLRPEYEYKGSEPPLIPDDYRFKTGLYWYLAVGPAHQKWAYLLEDLDRGGGQPIHDDSVEDGYGPPVDVTWTNNRSVFVDPWGNWIQYRVGTNFQSYALWSPGPPGDDDPIGKTGYAD